MVALGDVKRWQADTLEQVFRTVHQRQAVLTSAGDDFIRVVPIAGWTGAAANNAESAHRSLVSSLDKLAAGVSIVNKTISQAADAIPAVQREIDAAEQLAGRYGYRVGGDGSVIDVLTMCTPNDPSPQGRERARQQVIDQISAALRTAGDIDKDLADVLRKASAGEFGTGTETTIQGAAADALQESPGEVLTPPPANGTPSQNAAWWNSLSAAGRQILLRDHPDWLGNMNGLPGAVRSQANMARIPGIRAQLQKQLDDLNKQAEEPMIGDGDAGALGSQIDAVEAKLHSLDTIQATMAQGDRQLLLLDASQPRMEAAVGDIDTATNVAVLTPGFTTTVDGALQNYDEDMKNLKAESDRMTRKFGGGPTATVTWIGYQAPQVDGGLVDPTQSVASPVAAERGGASLAQFYGERALTIIGQVAQKYGFTPSPQRLYDKPNDHDAAFHSVGDDGRITLGTAKHTVLGFDVGCHLTAVAKARGHLAPPRTY